MLVQKMFKGYKVHKYEPFNFGAEELATITLVVPRSELTNDDDIADDVVEPVITESILEEKDEQVLVEETETSPELPSEHEGRLIATHADEEIDLGIYHSPESDLLIEEHGFTHAGIELVLIGKQKTHKKYGFSLV